ncbi:hypothetical protein NE237_018112 [Protea cynaroides]|uniref:Mur ligase central domain-containing protein n=1 Tax=Protea cynaroides TaxID=273540 RepID=A0A9Q0K998_9MAGN|nr:hypothetical protein NE237_018112 [Protea cynaroides]
MQIGEYPLSHVGTQEAVIGILNNVARWPLRKKTRWRVEEKDKGPVDAGMPSEGAWSGNGGSWGTTMHGSTDHDEHGNRAGVCSLVDVGASLPELSTLPELVVEGGSSPLLSHVAVWREPAMSMQGGNLVMRENGTLPLLSHVGVGFSKGSVNRDFLKEAQNFDIALFTNLTRDHMNFHGSHEEYKDAKAKPFARMVEPERHRKIVNIDDPMASLFTAQGNPDVPIVTYAVENKRADVHSLKIESCDILNVAVVKALGFGRRRKALLQDIAISTGAKHQASDLELLIENTSGEQLGVSIKWTFTKESTAFPYLIFYDYHFDTNLLKGTLAEPKMTTTAVEPFLLIAVRGQEVERPPVWL